MDDTRPAVWAEVTDAQFENHFWQDQNSITEPVQLHKVLSELVPPSLLAEIGAGLKMVGMTIRLNPYVMSLIDWSVAETDPIRRQFLPMRSELEEDHPQLVLDSLHERDHSPVPGIVHRYPDKVLFLVTSVCPVYCQYCTRSYAVGADTALVQKDHVTGPQTWGSAIAYIRSHSQVEDIVISGGDVARLRPEHIRKLGQELLAIDHVRRLRFATKSLAVQPMKFLSDEEWLRAIIEVVESGRQLFKDVCVHTHFNHPREVTPLVEKAMRRLHGAGVVVRNQSVLLRGVNDDASTLRALFKALGRVNIHPYYVYVCDLVKSIEHFRLPLHRAQCLEKEVRGATAGFNTPLFVVDTAGGKRDVHSAEFYSRVYGISGFAAHVVAPDETFYYFDPLRSLGRDGRAAWRLADSHEELLLAAREGSSLQPATVAP